MSERQLRSAEKVHGDTLRLPSEKPQLSAYDLFEKSLHLGIPGSVATLRLPRGRFPPGMLLSEFSPAFPFCRWPSLT